MSRMGVFKRQSRIRNLGRGEKNFSIPKRGGVRKTLRPGKSYKKERTKKLFGLGRRWLCFIYLCLSPLNACQTRNFGGITVSGPNNWGTGLSRKMKRLKKGKTKGAQTARAGQSADQGERMKIRHPLAERRTTKGKRKGGRGRRIHPWSCSRDPQARGRGDSRRQRGNGCRPGPQLEG